jgi:pyridoxine/pyridoxamine 5'-phosphate oxidase
MKATMALAEMRMDSGLAGPDETDLARDAFRQFEQSLQEAEAARGSEAKAMEFWRYRRGTGRDGFIGRLAS